MDTGLYIYERENSHYRKDLCENVILILRCIHEDSTYVLGGVKTGFI